ncbi:MAG: hypothetical protein NT123_24555 [Proteobacteria bacterium]|nr:hypothetical protein [Pseudomonadota bacterium]
MTMVFTGNLSHTMILAGPKKEVEALIGNLMGTALNVSKTNKGGMNKWSQESSALYFGKIEDGSGNMLLYGTGSAKSIAYFDKLYGFENQQPKSTSDSEAGAVVASAPQTTDRIQDEIAQKVTIVHDEFKKHTAYMGPNSPNSNQALILIRAWKFDDGAETRYQVFLRHHYYGDWRFYSSAYDDNGDSLDLTKIAHETVSCSNRYCRLSETIGINIPRQYLENKKESGMRFKISGKAGEEIFTVPPIYIKAILSAIPADLPKRVSTDLIKPTPTLKEEKPDIRTPAERYDGAFQAARMICGATFVLSRQYAASRERGIAVAPDAMARADLPACQKKYLGEMEVEYKKFNMLQTSKDAKDALTDHYVATVLAVRGISPYMGESESDYKARQIGNKQKADEKWVRYELAK